jgi:hypothetical protein
MRRNADESDSDEEEDMSVEEQHSGEPRQLTMDDVDRGWAEDDVPEGDSVDSEEAAFNEEVARVLSLATITTPRYLKLVLNTKRPAVSDWNFHLYVSPSYDEINTDYNNVGFLTGKKSNVVVVDLDDKKLLELPIFKSNITFTVETPNGFHLYYKYEAGFGNAVRINGMSIDIRTDNGYVVFPGSTVNEKEYTFHTEAPVAEMSSELLKFLKPKEEKMRLTESLYDIKLEHKLDIPVDKRETLINAITLGSDSAHEFEKISANQSNDTFKIYYKRTESSRCELCERTHDKDKTRYLRVVIKDDYSICYLHCMRTESNSILFSNATAPLDKITFTALVNKRIKLNTIDGIDKVQCDVRYVSDIAALQFKGQLPPGIIGIRSPMGTGKSKWFEQFVLPHNKEIGEICHRTSLINDKMNNLYKDKEFTSYADVKKIDETHARWITTVESLVKLQIQPTKGSPYLVGTLLLDELRGIRSQIITSPYLRGCQAYAQFKRMVKYARTIVCLDADLTPEMLLWLKKIREKPDDKNTFYYNTRNVHSGKTAAFYKNRTKLKEVMFEQLKRGKKVFICSSDGVRKQEILCAKIIEKKHTCLLINSRSKYKDDVKAAMKNPALWAAYDAVIISPTITVGVDFNADYFDAAFGFFNNSTIQHEDSIQMLGRVRKCRSFFINIQSTSKYLSTSKETLLECMRHNQYKLTGRAIDLPFTLNFNGRRNYVMTDYMLAYLDCKVSRNRSLNTMLESTVQSLVERGFTLSFVDVAVDEKTQAITSTNTKVVTEKVALVYATEMVAVGEAPIEIVDQIEKRIKIDPDSVSYEETNILRKAKTIELFRSALDEKMNNAQELAFFGKYTDHKVHKQFRLQKSLLNIKQALKNDIDRLDKIKENKDIRSSTQEFKSVNVNEAFMVAKALKLVDAKTKILAAVTEPVMMTRLNKWKAKKRTEMDTDKKVGVYISLLSPASLTRRIREFKEDTTKKPWIEINTMIKETGWCVRMSDKKKKTYRMYKPNIFTYAIDNSKRKQYVPHV